MRSRYAAFAVGDGDYLLATWHASTRPPTLELDPTVRWYRLDIESSSGGGPLDSTGIVAFTARFRDADGPGALHEISSFVREGRWYYLAPV
jgi:SEC-C motif-containing protein